MSDDEIIGRARLVKENIGRWTGEASVYRCEPPMRNWQECDEDSQAEEYEYVVVSTTNVPMSGWETYIFGSDEEGTVLNWCELPGSQRGGVSHSKALRDAGYQLVAGVL